MSTKKRLDKLTAHQARLREDLDRLAEGVARMDAYLRGAGDMSTLSAHLGEPRSLDAPFLRGPNPLSRHQRDHLAAALGQLAGALRDGQIVHDPLVAECQGDLLGAVGQEVDGVSQLPHGRITARPELLHLCRCGLTVLDAIEDHLFACGHDSSFRCSEGAATPSDDSVEGAGGAGVAPSDPSTLPLKETRLSSGVTLAHGFFDILPTQKVEDGPAQDRLLPQYCHRQITERSEGAQIGNLGPCQRCTDLDNLLDFLTQLSLSAHDDSSAGIAGAATPTAPTVEAGNDPVAETGQEGAVYDSAAPFGLERTILHADLRGVEDSRNTWREIAIRYADLAARLFSERGERS